MNELLDHLNQVSVFGRSTLELVVILGLDLAFTLLHTLQEWKGSEVPLWRYFGAIVGLWIPNWLGFPSFTVGLTFTPLAGRFHRNRWVASDSWTGSFACSSQRLGGFDRSAARRYLGSSCAASFFRL